MIQFGAIRRVIDGRCVRLHAASSADPHFVVTAQSLAAVLGARAALPSEQRRLPLRLPVVAESMGALLGPLDQCFGGAAANVEFGIVPWAPHAPLPESFERSAWRNQTFTLLSFGAGYSSLASIRRYPIGAVEVAQSFFDAEAGEPSSASFALLRAMTETLGALGLRRSAQVRRGVDVSDTLRHLGFEEYVEACV